MYIEPIKSQQYCNSSRQSGDNAQEWIGRFRIAVAKCNYTEIDRQLKKHFIHGLNDHDILIEIICSHQAGTNMG